MLPLASFLLLAALAPPPAAPSPAPQATVVTAAGFDGSLAAGQAAFEAFDLQKAHECFTRASAFAPTPQARAMALIWLGVVAAENGDFNAASARFADATDLDPDVVVPDHLSPTLQQLIEDARARARAAAPIVDVNSRNVVDQPLAARPRWALLSGGAVTALGVLAVGGGAMVGMQAVTQRDVAQSLVFQNEAVAEYQKAREGALWSNVLYGAGGVLVATGGGLAVASFLGADAP